MEKKLIIFGIGEIAEMANYYFSSYTTKKIECFTTNEEFIKENNFCKKPIVSFEKIVDNFPPNKFEMHVAISYRKLNQIREQKYSEVKKLGYSLPNYISEKSYINKNVKFGDNCFVLENQIIQKNTIIGSNVMIWSGNHIGHGTKIGDHTYLSSHIVLSGNCEIGKRCFFGINSSLADFCKIGDDCFIGMGADVSRNLKNKMSSINNSTKYFDEFDKSINIIKKRYFKF